MSGAANNGNNPRNRGNGGRGRGRTNQGRGTGNTTSLPPKKGKGACKALGTHVFEHGQRGSADQMRNTYYKAIIKHVVNTFGTNMSTELRTRVQAVIPAPEYSAETLKQHELNKKHRPLTFKIMQDAREDKLAALQLAGSAKDGYEIAILKTEIQTAAHEYAIPLKIKVVGADIVMSHNAWKAHGIERQQLALHCGKVFEIILGQCTQNLIDKMKYDTKYVPATESKDPQVLYSLIERTVLSQTEYTNIYTTGLTCCGSLPTLIKVH